MNFLKKPEIIFEIPIAAKKVPFTLLN